MPNKKIIITGCSSGFGLLMAHRFAKDGWQVLATTRHPEKLSTQVPNLQVLPVDIYQANDRIKVTEYVQQIWRGSVDCLINNAGYGLAGPFEMLTEQALRHQIEVNFFAPLLLTQGLLPSLRTAKGKIIHLSSSLGFTGMPLHSLYAASKFALEGWSESLYYELAPHGVQVALVEPGGFRTNFSQNMVWSSESNAGNALYDKQLQGFQNFFKKLSARGKGKNPDQVVDAIVSLANRSVMPLRTRVGQDAHALYYLRRLLPQCVADRVLRCISNHLLGL